ncbi:Uncharacterised protein [uncultured archaeon]|nr:Uncharacterised protein [uncultured archaeon]
MSRGFIVNSFPPKPIIFPPNFFVIPRYSPCGSIIIVRTPRSRFLIMNSFAVTLFPPPEVPRMRPLWFGSL